jgi:hypothetical protein
MAVDKQVTSEEAGALRGKAVQASIERDAAIKAAVRASGREAVAREDAREQHGEALSAQAEAIQAAGREAIAVDDAREQHVEALSAQAEAAHMNTLRHVANERADSEARSGNRARFVLLLVTGIMLVVFVVVIGWLLPR